MTAPKRLDTPFKRVFLLVFIAGIAILALSLAHWGWENRDRRIIYTEDRFIWAPASNTERGDNVERYWSIDLECVAPFEQALIERAEQELQGHLENPPKPPVLSSGPSGSPVSRSLSVEWRGNAVRAEAYLAWSARREKLEQRVAAAKDSWRTGLHGDFYYGVHPNDWPYLSKRIDEDIRPVQGVPEGESRYFYGIREGGVQSVLKWSQSPGGWVTYQSPPKVDKRSAAQRFRDALDLSLGLSRFPAKQRRELFNDCVRAGRVQQVADGKTYHSDLVLFPGRDPTFLLVGLTMVFVGYLGSFGYRGGSRLLAATVGRLFSWIRNG